MATLIGLSGSLRKNSLNTALLRAAAERAPDGTTVEVHTIEAIPLYNGDVEDRDGIPDAVTHLKDRIADSDGLVLVSPEYNNSLPGPLKNAVDWLTRPPRDIGRVFRGRPVLALGATPGALGTRNAQTAWLPVFRTLGMVPWFQTPVYVPRAGEAFDDDGRLVDPALDERLKKLLDAFARFAETNSPRAG